MLVLMLFYILKNHCEVSIKFITRIKIVSIHTIDTIDAIDAIDAIGT